jgi:hypothetical protein
MEVPIARGKFLKKKIKSLCFFTSISKDILNWFFLIAFEIYFVIVPHHYNYKGYMDFDLRINSPL